MGTTPSAPEFQLMWMLLPMVFTVLGVVGTFLQDAKPTKDYDPWSVLRWLIVWYWASCLWARYMP